MTTHTEALKLALDWFTCYQDNSMSRNNAEALADEVMTAIKEALAQPKQEPVAWMDIDEKGAASGLRYWHEPENRHEVPLYTTPPHRTLVELTKGEIDSWELPDKPTVAEFAWFVESKIKEKNHE